VTAIAHAAKPLITGGLSVLKIATKFADRKRIRELQFPDPRSKFPVPISRELSAKEHVSRGVLAGDEAQIGPKFAKFPVFSLLIREFDCREQFAADCVIRQ